MSRDTGPVDPSPPNYKFPRLPLVRFGLDILLGRRRSLLEDSQRVMAANPYRRQVQGLENVPAEGPFVLVSNHHTRRGLQVYHCAMFITTVIAERRPLSPGTRWVITSEWYGYRIGPIPIPVWLLRWVFKRVAKIYELVVMPRQASLAMGRAAVLRHIARIAQSEPIGLMPEAGGSGILREPLEGSGLFLQALSQRGLPLVPTGVWEEDDTLIVRFGEPFALSVAKESSRQEQDRQAREQVMVAVGRLLPPAYWGYYREAIQRSLGEG
jgi:1-acyl-sn-glycerol-3-phosphate acyltransferase